MISSTLRKEGKSFISQNLAIQYARLGWKTAYIDFNLYNKSLNLKYNSQIDEWISGKDRKVKIETLNPCYIDGQMFELEPEEIYAHKAFPQIMKNIKEHFEIVIIDGPAAAITIDTIGLMQYADDVLYIIRNGFTKKNYINYPDMIKEEYKVNNIRILINSLHSASNYNGIYTGTNFNYTPTFNWFKKIRLYFKTYIGKSV
jgi:Mrp family chromosome partitioning ATPase